MLGCVPADAAARRSQRAEQQLSRLEGRMPGSRRLHDFITTQRAAAAFQVSWMLGVMDALL